MVKITIPKTFMGIPVNDETMKKVLERTPINPPAVSPPVNPNAPVANGYIYVPSIGLYVAKQRVLQGKNWNDCKNGLHANGERMPTIPEFVEFIKYLRANPSGIKDANQSEVASMLDEVLTVRNPYRAEWLDADFKVKGKKLYVNYNVFENGKIVQKTEALERCLMTDKQPGIDLDSWLNNPTKQGLPKEDIANGTIWYWFPRDDNNSVAWFVANSNGADLDCGGDPAVAVAGLGVRAIRRASP
jgi:hypothetical protein